MVKENYCNCLWRVSKPAKPEVNDRSLTCFNGSSFGSFVNTGSSPHKIVQNRNSALKYIVGVVGFFFSLSANWIVFLFCVFLERRNRTCHFYTIISPQFHKNTDPDQENTLVKAMGLWICFAWAWADLPVLQCEQFARLSPPSLTYFELCNSKPSRASVWLQRAPGHT